jgi:lipopolysaccharide biosynthesis protein
MNMYLVILIIAIILIVVLYLLCRRPDKPVLIDDPGTTDESFTYPAMEINAAVLYTVYKADENDYKFVEKYYKDIPFYIVNNGEETEWFKKMKELPGVQTMTRENKGWDAGAWKNGLDRWDHQLSKYDLVAFVNNSCVYLFDLYMFFSKAMGYDMYGVTHMTPPFPYHLSAIFIVFSKKLYKSDLFRQHWNSLRDDSDRNYAIVFHEMAQSKKILDQGYKVGVYDPYNGTFSLYGDYDENRRYGREFIKKTNMLHTKKQNIDEQIEKVRQHNESNGYI